MKSHSRRVVHLLGVQVLPQYRNQLFRLFLVTTGVIQFCNELFLTLLLDSEHFLKRRVLLLVLIVCNGQFLVGVFQGLFFAL